MTTPPTTIPEVFRAVVDAYPEVVALRDEDTALTFRELEMATNHVAAEFSDRTSLGAPIGIVAEHRVHIAVSMLAAVNAGRIAVVLDAREPPARVAQLAGLAGCELLVASDVVRGLDVPHVHSDSIAGQSTEYTDVQSHPEDVAAVYYTSGSTGTPKGVALTHANLIVRTRHQMTLSGYQPGEVFALLGNQAFGYSFALWVAVLGGLTGRFLDLQALGMTAIQARLRDEGISYFGGAPLLASTLAEGVLAKGTTIESVRVIGAGGEAMRGSDLEALFKAFPSAHLEYHYGCTETAHIAHRVITPEDLNEHGELRVWEVVPGTSVELVNDAGEVVAPGEVGEVVASGPGVALGYWRNEALTNEWFSSAPDGSRRARTGDLATFNEAGALVLAGRRDDQVKVRGQRVDLAIVAGAITQISGVSDAIALSDDEGGVVAYVVPNHDRRLAVRDLRSALSEQLPGYMMPREFVLLKEVPRTPRGKLDRTRLREIRAEAAAQRAPYVAPTSAVERRIAHEFESMLGITGVGVDDDFFELGGDSLVVLELLEVISEEFSIDLHDYLALESTVHTLASVRELARAIDGSQNREPRDPSEVDPAQEDVVLRPDGTAVLRVGTHVDGGIRLFLVPGAGEGTVRFLALANALQECTVFSFHRRGLQTRDRPDRTIEQLATRLVSALQYLQPTGPYLLGGFSFGNTVAYEMAQQLDARGEHVALLVMIDALDPDDEPQHFRRVQRMRSRVMRYLLGKPSASRVARARDLADQTSQMGAEYRPLPYDGHTLIIESIPGPDGEEQTNWSPELTGRVERLRLDGTHLGMLGPANSEAIAERVDALIERIAGRPSSEPAHRGDVGELDDPGLGSIRRG